MADEAAHPTMTSTTPERPTSTRLSKLSRFSDAAPATSVSGFPVVLLQEQRDTYDGKYKYSCDNFVPTHFGGIG